MSATIHPAQRPAGPGLVEIEWPELPDGVRDLALRLTQLIRRTAG